MRRSVVDGNAVQLLGIELLNPISGACIRIAVAFFEGGGAQHAGLIGKLPLSRPEIKASIPLFGP
ncbi:MAG: hypothetical protein ACLFWL_15635, partial [Candidatus Brocadiia bacterium]